MRRASTTGICCPGPKQADMLAPVGVIKHSIVIAGHRTSVSLEAPFWLALRALAARSGVSLAALVAAIDAGRGETNLSSALRVHILTELTAELAAKNAAL